MYHRDLARNMPGRRPRHIRKSARNDAQCGDLKKRPSPQRDLAKSLFLSSMHSCEIANCEMGTNMARTLRNIRLKGASSPLLKHHDRQTAEHSQRNRWAQLAVSTGTTASCAVARAALDVRAVAAGRSAFASERPFSAPFSALSAFPTSSVFNSFLTV